MREVADVDGVDQYVFPMSFAQQRLWFLDQMAPGNPFYNIPLAIPIRHRIDPATLERAINEVVRRHESLRTTFRVIAGEPVQVISQELHIPLACVTLDHLRDKIEGRYATALGMEELVGETEQGGSVAELEAKRKEAAEAKLEEIRRSLGR